MRIGSRRKLAFPCRARTDKVRSRLRHSSIVTDLHLPARARACGSAPNVRAPQRTIVVNGTAKRALIPYALASTVKRKEVRCRKAAPAGVRRRDIVAVTTVSRVNCGRAFTKVPFCRPSTRGLFLIARSRCATRGVARLGRQPHDGDHDCGPLKVTSLADGFRGGDWRRASDELWRRLQFTSPAAPLEPSGSRSIRRCERCRHGLSASPVVLLLPRAGAAPRTCSTSRDATGR